MKPEHNATHVSGEEVALLVQPVLVDLVALALEAKQSHWHVQGRHFTQVHKQLDTLVADARRFSDDLAERVVALGTAIDGRPEVVAETTQVPSGQPGFVPDDKVVTSIVEQLDAVIARARRTLDPLDSLDLVTQETIIELLRELEKHRWMFAGQVSS